MRYSAHEYCIILYVILFCFVYLAVQSDAFVNYTLPTSRYTGLAAAPVFNPFSNGLFNNPYMNNSLSFSSPSLSTNYINYGLNGAYFNTPAVITPGGRIWNQNQDYSGLSVNYQEPASLFGPMSEQFFSQGAFLPGIGSGGMESLGLGFPGIGMPGMGLPGLGLPGLGVSGLGLTGLGFPGIGMQTLGLLGLSGLGFPGIGMAGLGLPGLGFPGIGVSGLGLSGLGLSGLGFPGVGASGLGLTGLGFPGIGILDPGLYEIGHPGTTISGPGFTVGGAGNNTTQFPPDSPVLYGPFGELISELPLEALPEYISSIIPTLPILPPLDLSIPLPNILSQIYIGATIEGMSQTIHVLLMDNGYTSEPPLKDILGEGIYCIKMNNGPGLKTSINIQCGGSCYTLSLYLEVRSLSPIWAWNAKWW